MSDLRGFTSFSERLDPQQVVVLLNRYLETMVALCKKYNGSVTDIIGDALLVTFGAPLENKDHTGAAVTCLIEMQNAMIELNRKNVEDNLPELEMGIGLHKAEVVVGNIGTKERSKFSVVGAGVNMASRIESYTVGGQVFISESVANELTSILRIDNQQEVMPKGVNKPIMIYEVGGIAGKYNKVLMLKETRLRRISREIPTMFNPLDGKNVGTEKLNGTIIKLSRKSAEMNLQIPQDLMTNLRINLAEVSEELSRKDIYGKIIKSSMVQGENNLIHFTALPSEIDAYFQALLSLN